MRPQIPMKRIGAKEEKSYCKKKKKERLVKGRGKKKGRETYFGLEGEECKTNENAKGDEQCLNNLSMGG